MIRFESVAKSFDAGHTFALRAVDLEVLPGETLVLLGSSGSGKSTLLRLVNRLITPSSGRVLLDGRDVAGEDAVALRRRIGYVFQGIGLFPHMTVAENVGTVPRLLNWPSDDIAERVDQLLELVGLSPSEYHRRYPRELSGGQQQRVGVARALAARPSVLLMDEPFGALDPITRDQIQDELKTLQGALGLTIVLVTHDMTEALLLADRIAVMKDGQIVGTGTPTELMSEPGHEYVSTLMAMPKRQADRVERIARGAS